MKRIEFIQKEDGLYNGKGLLPAFNYSLVLAKKYKTSVVIVSPGSKKKIIDSSLNIGHSSDSGIFPEKICKELIKKDGKILANDVKVSLCSTSTLNKNIYDIENKILFIPYAGKKELELIENWVEQGIYFEAIIVIAWHTKPQPNKENFDTSTWRKKYNPEIIEF